MKKILIILMILCAIGLYAQQSTPEMRDPFMNYNTLGSSNVTIQRNTNFVTAIKIIENLSLREETRNIINLSSFTGNIPIQINNLPWKEALDLIVRTVGVKLDIRPGAYIISDSFADTMPVGEEFRINEKMVRINATFFHADRTFMKNMGINWNTLIDGEVIADVKFHGTSTSTQMADVQMFQVAGGKTWESDSGVISLDALFNFMESNNRGSVLAQPAITVLNGREGNFQVGQDFSVKTRDEAGNTTEEFFSTGIILTVTPTIITDDGFEAIHLEVRVEKSDAMPGVETTLVNKNQARTNVILFNGEEHVIGGLNDSETIKERIGMPILKDLPWWVFGLKYLFSYSSTRIVNREVIVILKAEIVPPARDRIEEREALRERIKQIKKDYSDIADEVGFERK